MQRAHPRAAPIGLLGVGNLDTGLQHVSGRIGGEPVAGLCAERGFGGCVVVLCSPGAIDPDVLATPAWEVEAVDGIVAARRADRSMP